MKGREPVAWTPAAEIEDLVLKCLDCGHVWAHGQTPMELSLFAKMLRHVQCARCGATAKRIGLSGLPLDEAAGR